MNFQTKGVYKLSLKSYTKTSYHDISGNRDMEKIIITARENKIDDIEGLKFRIATLESGRQYINAFSFWEEIYLEIQNQANN